MTDKPTLSTRLDVAAPEPETEKPILIEMQGDQEADSIMRGWILIQHRHELKDGRYIEYRLIQTKDGAFVAASGHRSDNPGETSYWRVAPVETIADAMEAWGWSPSAKRIAKQQGWDARRRFA